MKTVWKAALGLTACLACFSGGLRAAETAPGAPKMTRQQFDALPDTAVLDVKGRKITAGELRARSRANESRLRTLEAQAKAQARAKLDAVRAAFLSDQRKALLAANATVRSEFLRLSPPATSRLQLRVSPAPGPALPKITGVTGTAKPGAALVVKGQHLGSPGQVLLNGLPGGSKTLQFDPDLLFPWQDDQIAVVVPVATGALQDQQATLQVVRGDGKTTDFPLSFHAEVDIVAFTDFTNTACGQDATRNRCDHDAWEWGGAHTEDTFWEEDAAGCDRWKGVVKNGWSFHSMEIAKYVSGGSVGNPGGPSPGSTTYEWNVCWSVNGAGPYSGNSAGYLGTVYVIGPKGFPW